MTKAQEKEFAYIQGKLELPTDNIRTSEDWKVLQRALDSAENAIFRTKFGRGNKELKKTVLKTLEIYGGILEGVIEMVERNENSPNKTPSEKDNLRCSRTQKSESEEEIFRDTQ